MIQFTGVAATIVIGCGLAWGTFWAFFAGRGWYVLGFLGMMILEIPLGLWLFLFSRG